METVNDGEILQRILKQIHASDKIIVGGAEFEEWARAIALASLGEVEVIASGGLFVPQMGIQSGEEVHAFEELDGLADDPGKLGELRASLNRFWEEPHTDSDVLPLGNGTVVVVSPVAYGFDRPIGYFWATVDQRRAPSCQAALDVAMTLISLLVLYRKVHASLALLSQPMWRDASGSAVAARNAADWCLQALGCKAAIVWEVQRGRSANWLRVLATTGNAQGYSFDMKVGMGVAGRCATDDKPVMIDDLSDAEALAARGFSMEHPQLVAELGWRSALFVPLDVGDGIAGVLAAYAERARAFSVIELDIVKAFAQRLNTGYVNLRRLEQLTQLERRLKSAAPIIETGMSATENVHDLDENLLLTQDKLSAIKEKALTIRRMDIAALAEKAGDQIQQASRILRDIITRTKITKVVPSKCDLRALVREAERVVADRADAYGCTVYNNCPVEPDAILIYVDKQKIRRVLVNLFDNALYFLSTDTKGGAKKIEIDARRRDERFVEVVFRDNGPGIADSHIDHIFEFLFSSKGDDGSGLGLAISKTIIESHGGTITANSRFGKQTEIVFTLPLAGA